MTKGVNWQMLCKSWRWRYRATASYCPFAIGRNLCEAIDICKRFPILRDSIRLLPTVGLYDRLLGMRS